MTDLEQAIATFRQVAVTSFYQAVQAAGEQAPQNGTPKDIATWEARVAKAKADMASALQQIVQADVMLSELTGRASYRALADLVTNTNAALTTLMNTTTGTIDERQALAQLLSAHAALLQALANLAPLATWQAARST